MKTIIQLLENSVQKYADNPYLLEKKSERYEATTYRETKEQVYKVAAGLMALGVQKGDRIALISESRTDWVISELGVLHAGAVSVPLSILLKEGVDLKFRLEHSEVRMVVVSGNQLMLYNNQNKYTTCLLVPNKEDLERWAKSHGIHPSDPGFVKAVLLEIESVINQYKPGGKHDDLFPSRWLPAAVVLLGDPFTLDNGMLNSTGKMVRSKVVAFHQDKIDYAYSPGARTIVNPVNEAVVKNLYKIS